MSSEDAIAVSHEQARSWARSAAFTLAVGVVVILTSSLSYLLYHFLVEFFTIAVAFLMGVVSWHTYPLARNGMLAFLGIVFPAVATIDLAHTVVYEGMAMVPTSDGADAPTQLWIAARYVQALAMLAAPAFIGRELPRVSIAAGAALLAGLLIALVAWDIFPAAYVDGIGLTPFKIGSEYVIILLFAAALLHLLRCRATMDPAMRRLLVGALLSFIAAEFAFTLYVGTYDLANLLGHLGKLTGFWLIFLAVVKTGMERPMRLLADKVSSYDAIPQPVIVVDRAGHIRQLNSAARAVAPDAGVGTDHHAFFHPPELPRDQCPICSAVAEGRRADDLEYYCSACGRWCVISVAPLALDRVAHAMVEVIHDVTARKEAELARHAAEDRLRLLLESAGEGICGVTGDGRVSFVNAAAARMLGYAPEDMIDRPLHALIHRPDESGEVSQCPMERALSDGLPHRSERESFLRSDGSFLPVAYLAMPLVKDGATLGAVVSFVDITARLAAAQALRDSEERFRSISAAALDALVMIDSVGNIVYWNPAAERMFGYPPDEVLGRNAHALLAPARYRHAYEPGLARFAASGTGPAIGRLIELVAVRKDGTEFPVELSISAFQLGGQWHAVGIIRDIAERKAAEATHRRLLAIIEATPDFIATFDPQGEVSYLNAAARNYVAGLGAAGVPLRQIDQAYPPRHARVLREEAIPGAMQTGVWQGELLIRGADHREIPVSQVILAHQDTEGHVTHLSTVARDINDRKRLEGALRAAAAREEHFANAVINSLPGFYFLVDARGRLHRWNAALEQVTGYTAEQLAHMHPLTLFRKADKASLRAAAAQVFESGRAEAQAALLTRAGDAIPCFMTGTRIDMDGKRFLTGTALDISALKQAEEALARSEARLRHALQCAHAGTWEVDLGSREVHWSEESYRLHGVEPATDTFPYDAWLERIPPDDRAKLQEIIRAALTHAQPDYSVDYRIMHPERGERWLGQFGRIHYGADGAATHISGLDLDITERKHAEELLQQLAKHDHLTGIYNRLYVSEYFCMQLKRAERYARPCSVVLFDLDHFKRVNDTYGHAKGDEVLKAVAEAVKACLREADIFVRWGGEEFLIIAPETDLDGARRLAEKMRVAIAGIRLSEMASITASFGVAQYRAGESGEKLITRADDALYAAKAKGRNRVEEEIAA